MWTYVQLVCSTDLGGLRLGFPGTGITYEWLGVTTWVLKTGAQASVIAVGTLNCSPTSPAPTNLANALFQVQLIANTEILLSKAPPFPTDSLLLDRAPHCCHTFPLANLVRVGFQKHPEVLQGDDASGLYRHLHSEHIHIHGT